MTASAVSRSLRRLHRDQRGVTAVIVVLTLPVLFAFGALVINSGLWLTIKRGNQSAADAAALSTAYELMAGPADACSKDPNFVANRLTPAATQAVAANQHVGWDTTGTTTTVTCPYTDTLLNTEFGAGSYTAVAVTLQQDQSSLFAFAPLASATIATKSVGVVANAQDVCFLALGQSPSRSGPCPAGFGICGNGNVGITTPPSCAVVADSTADNSIDLVGGAASITAGAIVTAGGVAGSGGISGTHPTARTFSTPVPDPYATTLTHSALTSGMPTTPCPMPTLIPVGPITWSKYLDNCKVTGPLLPIHTVLSGNNQISGGLTVVSGTVLLNAGSTGNTGTYWITDGDLNVSGTLACTFNATTPTGTSCTPGGAGITIILTTALAGGGTIGTVEMPPGNNSLSMNAPAAATTANFKGDLIIQDYNGIPPSTTYTSTQTDFQGTPSATFTGLVYLPNGAMNSFGNVSIGGCFVLVVGYLRMSGNSNLDTTGCTAAGVTPPKIQTVVLGE